jgi:hypothetical protein
MGATVTASGVGARMRGRSAGLRAAVLLTVVVAVAGACGPPPPQPTYRATALASGNRIHLDVGGPGSPDNLIVSNPGGVTSWPSDPAAAEDLRLDTLGLGDPTSDLRFAPIEEPSFRFGIFDGDGDLVLDLGPDFGSTLFSADGSTFAVSKMFGPDPSVVVYDTDTLTVRRSIPWDADALGRPTVVDLSRDGSTILLRGAPGSPFDPPASAPVFVAATHGDDAPTVAAPPMDEATYEFRLTSGDRIAYVAEVVGPSTRWELRTIGTDGTDPRTLLTVPAFGVAVNLAAEIGTGRVIVEAPAPGSTVLSDLYVIDDSPQATRRAIARGVDISSTLGGLTRLVLPA